MKSILAAFLFSLWWMSFIVAATDWRNQLAFKVWIALSFVLVIVALFSFC